MNNWTHKIAETQHNTNVIYTTQQKSYKNDKWRAHVCVVKFEQKVNMVLDAILACNLIRQITPEATKENWNSSGSHED